MVLQTEDLGGRHGLSVGVAAAAGRARAAQSCGGAAREAKRLVLVCLRASAGISCGVSRWLSMGRGGVATSSM